MKPLLSGMCLLVTALSQPLYAQDAFYAYRLGDYTNATLALMESGNKEGVADYYLGRLFLYGYGQLKNNNLALSYFTKAAEKNYLPAVKLMASYSLLQEKNTDHALVWFKKAAAMGDVQSQMFMAAAYLYGFGVKQNEDVATKYYIDAAKNGNALAQFTLAENFIDSKHAKNTLLGVIWLKKAAKNGSSQAQSRLGSMYLDGKLVEEDKEQALTLLNSAAAQNLPSALLKLGELSLAQKDYPKATEWLTKAANAKDPLAYLALAHAYLQTDSPLHNDSTGFVWTKKAAEAGFPQAQAELASLYEKGIGITANPELATQWLQKSKEEEKELKQPTAVKVANWLSGGTQTKLELTAYQSKGIYTAWHNGRSLRDNIYNQAPQREEVNRASLFKPAFALTQPNEVSIAQYYDALSNQKVAVDNNQWTYPVYRLNKDVEALENQYSYVTSKPNLPAPLKHANYYVSDDNGSIDLMEWWIPDWQQQANYASVLAPLYFKALLGEAQSQFEIGQMFQYGIGVPQNLAAASIFYHNAADQQLLRAQYTLGILYLEHPQEKDSDQLALKWLTDAAFKGNKQSQYVLARLLWEGKLDSEGKPTIKVNKEQATSMLYLAAANNYGPAQFDLATNLALLSNNGLSLAVQEHKIALIRKLYEGAVENGVAKAALPLAFYNAMDSDKQKQAKAFAVAQSQAEAGDQKAALLLGLLNDRGIGVIADHDRALYWYKKGGENAVSQFILGTYLSEGKGIAMDKEQGMRKLQESAKAHFSYADFNLAALKQAVGEAFLPDLIASYTLGNTHAGIVLADYYVAMNKDEQTVKDALAIYKGLAEKGAPQAQLKYAFMLDKGLGTLVDTNGAQAWYMASAQQGNSLAQYLLGQWYQTGEGGEPDYALARDWYQKAASRLPMANVALGFIDETVDDNYSQALQNYEKAASKGDLTGIYDTALMYLYGKGLPTDFVKAKTLLTEVANKGHVQAMNELASMYFYGLGQPSDVQQGIQWYKKAADLGNAQSLYQLGLLAETGYATKLDFATALSYYSKSADKNDVKALLALARMHEFGLGVPKDTKKSEALYMRLAKEGNAYAQYRLGTYYLQGSAGETSADKGRQWLQKASESGSSQARKMLQSLDAKSLTSASYKDGSS